MTCELNLQTHQVERAPSAVHTEAFQWFYWHSIRTFICFNFWTFELFVFCDTEPYCFQWFTLLLVKSNSKTPIQISSFLSLHVLRNKKKCIHNFCHSLHFFHNVRLNSFFFFFFILVRPTFPFRGKSIIWNENLKHLSATHI